MEAKRGELEVGLQIVIQRLVGLLTLAAPAQRPDGHHGLGVQGQADRAGVRVGLAIEALHRRKDRVGLRHFAQGLAAGGEAGGDVKCSVYGAKRAVRFTPPVAKGADFGGRLTLANW